MPFPVILQNESEPLAATIAATGNLSARVTIPPGHEVVALLMPAVWTSAGITFQASVNGSTFGNVFIAAGTEYALVVVATHYVPLPPGTLNGANYLKVRSGTAASPVAQAAERIITLVTRPTA